MTEKRTDLQIVGLGLATLDVLIRTRDLPTWEHGARLTGFSLDGGGPVGTAIVAAARLGARTGFVGTAGNDAAAEVKMQTMVQGGVDLSRMVYRDAPEDQIVVVTVHADTGERIFSGVGGWGHEQLRVEELDREYITSAEYLHLEGFHGEAALQAAKWMHEAGKTVVLDGGKTSRGIHERMRTLVQHVDILITGSGFAEALTGERDMWKAGEAVLKMGPRVLVQTEGEQGSYTVTADERFHMPAYQVDVVDTTGAGDVFHGAYIVGLLHGWSLRQVAQFSSAVSAIKCTRLGGRAGIPGFDAVIEFLRQRDIILD